MDTNVAEFDDQSWIQDASDLFPRLCYLQSINLKDAGYCKARISSFTPYGERDRLLPHTPYLPEEDEGSFVQTLRVLVEYREADGSNPDGLPGHVRLEYLLPLVIHQFDLETQQHTNVRPLEHLLWSDNGIRRKFGPSQLGKVSDGDDTISIAGTSSFRPRSSWTSERRSS